MISVGLQIKDRASLALRVWMNSARGPGLLNAMGTAVKRTVQDHFLGLPSNKMGFPTSNFYKRAARATAYVPGTGRVTVSGPLGIAQRYFGGRINAVNSTFLTIPAVAAAYGRRAREFHFLSFGFAENQWGKMQPALIERDRTEVRRVKSKDGSVKFKPGKQRGGGVYYWLTRSVEQKADPDILPKETEMAATAIKAGNALVARWNRGGAA